MGVARQFGDFVAVAGKAVSPEALQHHCVRALIDWTGATIAGWEPEPANILATALSEELGQGTAQLLRHAGGRAPPRLAALLNGTASHVAEMDDIYSPGLYHPGSPTIASALASAQAANAAGRTLLRAIAVGYQVGNAVAKAVQPSHYRHWHTTGTVGAFGAAAAAAVTLNLTAVQAGHALATCATMAAALQQAFRSDSMSKALHAGRAAEAGLFAALCAARGLTGEQHMFEGPHGFGNVMSEHVDWDTALADLTAGWTIAETTHKVHACCGHTFAAIDSALRLRDAIGGARIEHIRVETYGTAIEVAGIMRPTTAFEARFSIAFTVATALSFGRVALEAFSPARLAHPTLRDLAARTEVVASAEFDRAYPALRGARLVISLSDGRMLSHRQPTRRGSPTDPLSDGELHAKFTALSEPVLGKRRSADLLRQLRTMADAPHCKLRLGVMQPDDLANVDRAPADVVVAM